MRQFGHNPPPPSTTFEIMPGGVAIMVQRPFTVSKLQVAALAEWAGEERELAGLVTLGKSTCVGV